jgi:hypothetical protein
VPGTCLLTLAAVIAARVLISGPADETDLADTEVADEPGEQEERWRAEEPFRTDEVPSRPF